ncbi:hypothetical protein FACS189472_17020 [Alphaproteobacteria bacterium]|nr:hypothetical protein FACS189472_17020 [Alphaproteobacteria bacterium]
MVGIFNKIKNGLNWMKGKALKYVAPVIGKLGDFAQSDFVQGIRKLGAPMLDSVIPGLGTGINTGLDWLGKAGDVANGLSQDYQEQGDNLGYSDIFKNIATGKYVKKRKVPDGISLAKNPDQLHERIQLKMLPAPDDAQGVSASYVEEID